VWQYEVSFLWLNVFAGISYSLLFTGIDSDEYTFASLKHVPKFIKLQSRD